VTIPYERTQSLLQARQLLINLASGDPPDWELVHYRARTLLRHFPEPADIALSGKVLPNIWAHPNAKWYE
jgi:hypothetical protein